MNYKTAKALKVAGYPKYADEYYGRVGDGKWFGHPTKRTVPVGYTLNPEEGAMHGQFSADMCCKQCTCISDETQTYWCRSNLACYYCHTQSPEPVYAPTLEDLIESVGNARLSMTFNSVSDVWIVSIGVGHTGNVRAEGKELTTALANLWIEINKE